VKQDYSEIFQDAIPLDHKREGSWQPLAVGLSPIEPAGEC